MTRLPYWQKLLYASGSLGVALSYQVFAVYIQFLYVDRLGLKASLVAAGWSVYGIWNAINDPLAGYMSDNTRSRWGRRRPWIAGTFIPLGLAFYLLWVPPTSLVGGDDLPLFVYFMALVLVFDLLWSIAVTNWTSLFPEMIVDTHERATVSGWRQFFSVIGLLVGVALPPIIVGADWSGRGRMATMFALITTASFALSLMGSREDPAVQQEKQPAWWPALRATFASRSFRWFLSANVLKEFIYILLGASIPFWSKYVLRVQGPTTVAGFELSAEIQSSLILGLAFTMALPGLPVWTWVAKKIGATRGWQISQATFAGALVLVFLADNFVQGATGTALAGLSLAGLLVFPDLLIADVIDEDERLTGARREGMYFGINGLIIRLAFTLQGVTTGVILSQTGYIASTEAVLYPAQPAAALLGMRVMTAGVPIVVSLMIIGVLSRYPLQGDRLNALRAWVAARQALGRVVRPAAAD